ncbi:ABC transporter permease [Anaerobacillus alkalidiazotrophicus]|uniref:ABC transporter permease n=1 Tax=Anaerobacillus alkalidiazotrophicus TaxID=472963 RepID=A0A1S2M3P9_9BACI|nr:ABC transporter permease [Anaerobacillus alkalidiazotrophicus]OIJ19264.1 ABC transporter permease [Anaerobacillus alkalidiazotrophicus]
MNKNKFLSFLLFITFISIWELVVHVREISKIILPAPSDIVINLINNFQSGYFYPHIYATTVEVLGGFFLGSFLGISLGFLVSQSKTAQEILQPYIIASQAMPKLALAPLLVLWFGFGYTPKIIIVALVCFFPLFESTVTGLTYVSREKLQLFHSLQATSFQTLIKLRLPTAIPYIFSGLRVAIVLSVVGAVVSEFIGASKGLGALIIASQGMLNTTLTFSVFILLTMKGMLLYQSIYWIEKLFLKKYIYSRGKTK